VKCEEKEKQSEKGRKKKQVWLY